MNTPTGTVSKALCLLAILFGLGLRFHRLAEPLWYDEAVSVKSASVPLSELPAQLTGGEDSNPPLFSLVLKAWMKLAGSSDARLHALTAAIGSATVISALWAAPAGPFAAALLALHPAAVVYSQEVRPYGLLIFLTLWSSMFLTRALKGNETADWIKFALATALCLYTHNYAVFLLLGQAAWAWRQAPGARRPFLLACAAALLAYAPWLSCALRQTRALPELPSIDLHGALFMLYAAGGLWTLAGPTVAHWPAAALPWLLALEVAVFAYAVARLRAKDAASAHGLFLAAAVATAVPVAVSLHRPIMLAGRHWVVALAPLILAAAQVLEALGDRAARLAALSLFLSAGAVTTGRYFAKPKSFDKDIAAFVSAHDAPDTRLLLYPSYRALAISRYYPRASDSTEGLEVGGPADLPAGLILMVEEDRHPKTAQMEALSRYYRLEASAVFGNLAAAAFRKKVL